MLQPDPSRFLVNTLPCLKPANIHTTKHLEHWSEWTSSPSCRFSFPRYTSIYSRICWDWFKIQYLFTEYSVGWKLGISSICSQVDNNNPEMHDFIFKLHIHLWWQAKSVAAHANRQTLFHMLWATFSIKSCGQFLFMLFATKFAICISNYTD